MTKQEYNDYIEALKARGYKLGGYKLGGSWYDNPYYYKVIEYREDEDGNRRAVCKLLFYLFEQEDNRSGYVYYSIEPTVMVSRNTDEQQCLTIIRPKTSIEEYEYVAKEFLRWVDVNVDIK